MKCSNCSAEMPDNAVFCANCGTRANTPSPTCPQCNKPVRPEAVFCPGCGNKLKAAASTQPVSPFAPPSAAARTPPPAAPLTNAQQSFAQQPYAQQPYAQQPYAQQPYAQQPYAQAQQPYPQQYAQPPYGQPYGQPYPGIPPRRRGKGLVVGLVVLLVVLLAAGGAYALFGNTIKKLFMSPEVSYLAVEGESLKSNAAELVADLAKYGNKDTKKAIGGQEVDLQISLDEEKLGVDPSTAAALENITIKSRLLYDRTGEKSKIFGSVDLAVEDEKLLTLEAFYDKEQLIVGLPGILGKSIAATADELSSFMGSTGVDTSQASGAIATLPGLLNADLGINEVKLKATFNKVIDIVLDHIDKTEFQASQTLKAGDVSASYDLYTITITKESARQMLLEICEMLKKDEEAFNLIRQIADLAAKAQAQEGTPADSMTLADYQAALDEMIADLKKDDSSEDFTLVQKVYVGKDDEIFGRDLTITSAGAGAGNTQLLHFLYAHPVSGNKEALVLILEADGESYEFNTSYTVADKKKTGKASVLAKGKEVLTATFKDLVNQETGDSNRLLGTVEVAFKDTGSSNTAIPAPTGVKFIGKMDGDRYVMSIEVPGMFALNIGYRELAASAVKFPAYDPKNLVSISSQEALQGLITPDVQEKFMKIVEQLGLMPTGND